ncbi:HlyD family efflux transporter periplasmic adaptor subunit [Niameybacter massiliensis]|uniref:HlyD family efflux transporter periplasmic adaptor subunit n=1 Tax=Holtiella tumoricola TaxID=3018743 RepID=A0AA42DKX4_9FIRM|nr:HlyD family efflux transporter periplasmic adaptor subunit [Holtiella tumoricola]MDA3730722.1 HlyD family efflux transporter periplasmic adaptor subunit [Holtiella tumoricola]
MKSKKKLTAIIVVVVIGVFLVAGMLKGGNQAVALAGDPKGTFVNVDRAMTRDIQTKISSTGTVKAEKSEVVFAEASTKVETIKVEVGDYVKQGDVLLTYDIETKENLQRDLEKLELQMETARIALGQLQGGSKQAIMQSQTELATIDKNLTDLEESIRQLETSLTLAKKDVEQAEKNHNVTKTLFDEGLAAQKELDDAEKVLLNAKEQVTSIESKIASSEKNIETANMQKANAQYNLDLLENKVHDETKAQNILMKQNEIASLELQKESLLDQISKVKEQVVAPMEGVVSKVTAQEGGFVAPGAELVTIINPDKLIVKAEISPYYAAQLETGLQVNVKYNGSTTVETQGTVSMVSPVAVQKAVQDKSAVSTAIPIEVTLENANGLKEGLTVDLKIITSDVKGVVAVPLLATMTDKEDENYLFVVGADNMLSKRIVKQGAADNQYVQVSDVNAGDLIVTNPTEALTDGMSVSYLPLEEVGE